MFAQCSNPEYILSSYSLTQNTIALNFRVPLWTLCLAHSVRPLRLDIVPALRLDIVPALRGELFPVRIRALQRRASNSGKKIVLMLKKYLDLLKEQH